MPTYFECGYLPSPAATASGASGRMYEIRALSLTNNTIPERFLVQAGDILESIRIRSKAASTTGTITAAAYVTDAATNIAGARVTTKSTFPIVGTADAWYTQPVEFDLTALAGQYIKPAGGYSALSDARLLYGTGISGDSYSVDSDCPTPLNASSARTNLPQIVLRIRRPDVAPDYDITSVNDDAITPGVPNTAVVVGYDDTTNPVISGTIGLLALTDISQVDDVVTFTAPLPENGEWWPDPGVIETLTFVDADENESMIDVMFNSLTGYTPIKYVDPDNLDEHKLPYHYTTEAVTDDTAILDLAHWGTFNTDGSFEDAEDGLTTHYHRINSSGLIYIYETTLTDGVIVESEITSVGTIRIGGTTTISVVGFEDAISAGTFDGVALTSADNTSIVLKPLTDGEVTYRPGIRELSLTDGTDTVTSEEEGFAPLGWSSYEIQPEFVQAINGVATVYLPVGWAVNDFILSPDVPSAGKTTSVGDFGVNTSNVGVQELFLVDAVTGIATAFTVTTTAGAGEGGSGSEYHGRFLRGSYV